MIETFLLPLLIIAICIALLAIKLLVRNEPFGSIHIDSNKALRKKGIHCVQTMDKLDRIPNPHRIDEHEKKH